MGLQENKNIKNYPPWKQKTVNPVVNPPKDRRNSGAEIALNRRNSTVCENEAVRKPKMTESKERRKSFQKSPAQNRTNSKSRQSFSDPLQGQPNILILDHQHFNRKPELQTSPPQEIPDHGWPNGGRYVKAHQGEHHEEPGEAFSPELGNIRKIQLQAFDQSVFAQDNREEARQIDRQRKSEFKAKMGGTLLIGRWLFSGNKLLIVSKF